uniref:Major facilitator superfamily (MFS) profile domain-containing protein n=1 Tax=Setaria digitata TaxID=48799 RepID=A0A915PI16_9BILA
MEQFKRKNVLFGSYSHQRPEVVPDYVESVDSRTAGYVLPADMKLLQQDIEGFISCDKPWSRKECRLWTTSLFFGTCMLYAARVALPVCATVIAHEYSWNKNDAGTVLSSFFWGYACTQVIAGHLADRMGAEKVLTISTLTWTLLTFFTPLLFDLSYSTNHPMLFIILIRSATGIGQAFHLPSMASMTSRHLTSLDKGRILGICLAGSHLGTALAGAIGSVLLETFGWRALFHCVGLISFIWWTLLHFLSSARGRADNVGGFKSDELKVPLFNSLRKTSSNSPENVVPWQVLLKHRSFWAAAVAQYCGANAYYTLFSWLPYYFSDTYPDAKGVVYNVVPSLAIVITAFFAPFIATTLFLNVHSLTLTRKLMECISLVGMAICLLISSKSMSFNAALFTFTLAMAARGFHHGGVSVNPCDLAPNHTGSVFGVFNAFSAITGFIGVYLAGYILHETGSTWAYVFVFTSLQCFIGAIVFSLFGTAKRII